MLDVDGFLFSLVVSFWLAFSFCVFFKGLSAHNLPQIASLSLRKFKSLTIPEALRLGASITPKVMQTNLEDNL